MFEIILGIILIFAAPIIADWLVKKRKNKSGLTKLLRVVGIIIAIVGTARYLAGLLAF